MSEEGKYIYGIIGTNSTHNFGPIGVGDQHNVVTTISYGDIGAVISNYPMGKYELSRENLLTHQKVVERVMQDHTVLPMRAFTVATSAEEVRDLLRKRYRELTGSLKDMDNKIELCLMAYWTDMPSIYKEILEENRPIRQLREKIAAAPETKTLREKVDLGKLVLEALESKKKKEGEEILRPLRKVSFDLRENDIRNDEMIVNAAFLIDRGWEKEFDSRVHELDGKCAGRIRFKCIGPSPPYNFVNLRI